METSSVVRRSGPEWSHAITTAAFMSVGAALLITGIALKVLGRGSFWGQFALLSPGLILTASSITACGVFTKVHVDTYDPDPLPADCTYISTGVSVKNIRYQPLLSNTLDDQPIGTYSVRRHDNGQRIAIKVPDHSHARIFDYEPQKVARVSNVLRKFATSLPAFVLTDCKNMLLDRHVYPHLYFHSLERAVSHVLNEPMVWGGSWQTLQNTHHLNRSQRHLAGMGVIDTPKSLQPSTQFNQAKIGDLFVEWITDDNESEGRIYRKIDENQAVSITFEQLVKENTLDPTPAVTELLNLWRNEYFEQIDPSF